MRNILRSLAAGLVAGCMLAGALAPAFALTVPPTFSPRYFPSQQKHYLRTTITFNQCAFVSLVASCKVGALPYNAFVTNIWTQVTTAFNAGTSDTVTIGTSSGGAQLMAGVAVSTTGNAVAQTVATPGIAATGNGITATGADGGFDVWVTQTVVGALPTTGQLTLVIEYFANNDGTCTPAVPLGGSAPAC